MIAIVAYEGVSGFEAMGALAAVRASGLDGELVADEALVLAQEGARIVPARLGYDALAGADAVVVPGGDVARPLRDATLAKALRARRGKWVLASGEAIRLLDAVGLTEGRRVARPPQSRLVADGRVLTCGGGDALIDLVLHYVSRAEGDAVSRAAAEAMGREHRVFALGAETE